MASPVSTVSTTPGDIIESVIAKGDLDQLSAQERTRYYAEVCKSVGLNPLTQPLAYIRLNGKLTLYALRGATDQLRTLHGVSVEDMAESERDGVYVVTCKVRNRDGRSDMAKGAVSIAGLKGEALANAVMKCETKAKRRATLSICGLGMLDESEVESVSNAVPLTSANVPERVPEQPALGPKVKPLPEVKPQGPVFDPATGEIAPHYIAVETVQGVKRYVPWGGKLYAALETAQSLAEGEEWIAQNAENMEACEEDHPKVFERIKAAIVAMRGRFPPPDFMPAA